MLGLQVVAEEGKHYWIERTSRPVLTQAFCDWLGATLVRDDNLFNAAVVSFGSFGLIHAVLFEAEPIFLLERHVRQVDYQDVVQAMTTLDVRSLGLPDGPALPFHFEVVLNPYRTGVGQKGAFVRVLYKRPAGETLPSPQVSEGQLLRSEDLVAVVGHLADVAPIGIPPLLQTELENSLGFTKPEGVLGTHSQQFGDTTPSGGGTSTEIGIPLTSVGDAVDAILSVTKLHAFGAPVAFRYVKASDALLALTTFLPLTCTIELPGVDAVRTREGFAHIWQAFRDRSIRHVFHWGQALPLNPEWVREGFGAERVQKWLDARRSFLGPGGRRMFANTMLEQLRLAD
jgi:hypothetical protein